MSQESTPESAIEPPIKKTDLRPTYASKPRASDSFGYVGTQKCTDTQSYHSSVDNSTQNFMCTSPTGLFDTKSAPSPNISVDRLKLIQILHSSKLEKALSIIPDSYTYENLATCSLEQLKITFSTRLTNAEIQTLYNNVHSELKSQAIPKINVSNPVHKMCPDPSAFVTTRPQSFVDVPETNLSISFNSPTSTVYSINCDEKQSCTTDDMSRKMSDDSDKHRTSNFAHYGFDYYFNNSTDNRSPSANVQRAVSLGADDIKQLMNQRQACLSASSTYAADSSDVSLHEAPNIHPMSISNKSQYDSYHGQNFGERKSNSQTPFKSHAIRSTSPIVRNNNSHLNDRFPRSHRDSQSLFSVLGLSSMSALRSPRLFDLAASPVPTNFANYENHCIRNSLLRMRSNFIGQSAPSLLHYMRDSYGSELSHNSHHNLPSRMNSAFTPPIYGLKNACLSATNAENVAPLSSSELVTGNRFGGTGDALSKSVNKCTNEHTTTDQPLHISTSLASVTSACTVDSGAYRSRVSLPYPPPRSLFMMMMSGRGSLSGSSSCMADRSLCSPIHSNGPDSPLFTNVTTVNATSHTGCGCSISRDSGRIQSGKSSAFFTPDSHQQHQIENRDNIATANKRQTNETHSMRTTHSDCHSDSLYNDNVQGRSSNSQCAQCGVHLISQTRSSHDKRHYSPRLRIDNKHLTDGRRWSSASLPSSGYGTNASESGSHLSRSRCSSRENVNAHSHSLMPTQSQLGNTSTTCTNSTISSSNTVQTTSFRASLPTERLSSCQTVSNNCMVSSMSPLSIMPQPSQQQMEVLSNDDCGSMRWTKDWHLSEQGQVDQLDHLPLSPLCTYCLSRNYVSDSPNRVYDQTPASSTPTRSEHYLRSQTSKDSFVRPSLYRLRSRSLSPNRMAGSNEQEILLLNHVYRERFPKASAHMQEQLTSLAEELENTDTVAWSAVARFVHCQIVQHAKDCLQKALAGVITCHYFYEMTENLSKLVEDTRTRDPDSVVTVIGFVRKLLLIIARPARLLECLEFDPSEFYQMLEVAEDQVRRQNSSTLLNNTQSGGKMLSADVPLYIISKLGLRRSVLNKSPSVKESVTPLTSYNDVTDKSDTPIVPCTRVVNQSLVEQNSKQGGNFVPIRAPRESDFEVIKLISNGAYGAVYLVRHKVTRQRFSLKKIRKQHLQLRNQVEQVFAERDIMSFADNPFVVSLCCTFETKKCLCMVMEYVEGGDVAALLKHIGGPLPLDLARMYFAETVLALEYLHNYGIVHRDLKPDNLLITHDGHIKLTDFGLSRIGLMNLATNLYEKNFDLDKGCKMFRDKQVFGTPEYIAPEVILRQGYGKPVDWWSMGIMLYEFLVGCVPFYGDTIEDLFSHIVTEPIEWPEEEEWKVTPSAIDLITKLLERDPLLRLGTLYGAVEIKETIFFTSPCKVDWNNLLRQKSAFVPQLHHDEDTSYFDPRTDRFSHDVDNDEDISVPIYPMAIRSNRSSPIPSLSSQQSNEQCFTPPPNQNNSSVIRRPAASRLGRAKQLQQQQQQQQQQQHLSEFRRSHSLSDTNHESAHSPKARSRSQTNLGKQSTNQTISDCLLTSKHFKSDPDQAGLTITANSSMMMMMNNHPSFCNILQSSLDKSRSHSMMTTVNDKSVTNKLTINDNSAVEDQSDTDSAEDVAAVNENSHDSRLFHSFASYSPRFSVVLEQTKLNELMQSVNCHSGGSNSNSSCNSHCHSADYQHSHSFNSSFYNRSLSNDISTSIKSAAFDSPTVVPFTPITGIGDCNQFLFGESGNTDITTNNNKTTTTTTFTTCSKSDGDNNHVATVDSTDDNMSTITTSSTNLQHLVQSSPIDQNNDKNQYGSVVMIENSMLDMANCSIIENKSGQTTAEKVDDIDHDNNLALQCQKIDTEDSTVNSLPISRDCSSVKLDSIIHSDSNSSLELTGNLNFVDSHTDLIINSAEVTSTNPQTDTNMSLPGDQDLVHSDSSSSSSSTSSSSSSSLHLSETANECHLLSDVIPKSSMDQYKYERTDKSIRCVQTRQPTVSHNRPSNIHIPSIIHTERSRNNSQSRGFVNAEYGFVNNQPIAQIYPHPNAQTEQIQYTPSPPSSVKCNHSGIGHTASSLQTRPSVTCQPNHHHRQQKQLPQQSLVIQKGRNGYGFTIRAIRVFFGTSDTYTLYHLVIGVDTNGPAARVGLKEADLILSVNDIPIAGLYHTDVVKLILQSGPVLRLSATALTKTSIRSDGPWRPSGRFIARIDSSNNHQQQSHKRSTPAYFHNHSPNRQTSSSYSIFPVCNITSVVSSHNTTESLRVINAITTNTKQKTEPVRCWSDNVRPTEIVLNPTPTINRRLTIRDTIQRQSNNDSKLVNLSADISDTTERRKVSTIYPQCKTTTTTLSGNAAQVYVSVNNSHRLVSGLSQLSNQSTSLSVSPTSHIVNPHISGHRRTLEKPLIRQLSERQHRAILTAADDTTALASNSSICSPRFNSPAQLSCRSDHITAHPICHRNALFNVNTNSPSSLVSPSSSSSSSSSPCPCSCNTVCGQSFHSPTSSSHLNPIGRADPSNRTLTQIQKCSNRTVPTLQLNTQISDANSGLCSRRPTYHYHNQQQQQQYPMSPTVAPSMYANQLHCRHSDPPRHLITTNMRSCGVNISQSPSFINSPPSLVQTSTIQNTTRPTTDQISTQANNLISTGQVRLRRHSHRFAVQHVASANSPNESGDDTINETG